MQVKRHMEQHMEKWAGSKLEKEYIKAVYYHLVYLTYMQNTLWEMSIKHKLESRLLGEISIASDMQVTPPSWQKVKTNLFPFQGAPEQPLDEGERAEWKSWFKAQHSENRDHGIRSHHFMANNGEPVETVRDFVFGGSKITAVGDCSNEIKRCLLLGRKAKTYSEY